MSDILITCALCGARNIYTYNGECPQCRFDKHRAEIGMKGIPIKPLAPRTTSMVDNKDKHIQITLRGHKQKQAFFHHILAECDRDWPFKKDSSLVCKICGGGIYKNPRFVPTQLKNLAVQINKMSRIPGHLKIKIRSFSPAKTCFDVAVMRKREEAKG